MEVTVVFGHHIDKVKDRVRQNFNMEITVCQAPPDITTDLVLMMARDEFDCVISNDNFSEHGERSVVNKKRVFRAIVTESTTQDARLATCAATKNKTKYTKVISRMMQTHCSNQIYLTIIILKVNSSYETTVK